MIRSRVHPWGFPWLSKKHLKDAELGNVLIRFMIEVLNVLTDHPLTPEGYNILVFGEHPEDLGVIWREEDNMRMEPASIWQLPRQLVDSSSPLQLFTVVFNQCCWGAPYRKPTRLLTNLTSLHQRGPTSWPTFDGQMAYTGPAVNLCSCQPSISLARAPDDLSFRTTVTSIYPEPMDRAIATAIVHQLSQAPSSAKEGGGRKREPSTTLSDSKGNEETSKARQVGTALSKTEEVVDSPCKATLCKTTLSKGRVSNRPGVGPPMQVKYKGELRSLHDGAGLCSPGRWPVGRRTAPATELGRELARWCLRAFEDWVELEGEERAKALFWSTAGGKHGGTPYSEERSMASVKGWTSG